MAIINKSAVLNPLLAIEDTLVDYVPRATTSKFGVVSIGSGINVDALGRIYLDTQEYSDRLTAIETQAASSLATQQTAVSAAIAQVNLAQSQTITALTLEVNSLKTNLTNSITATETNLINRADQLAQDVTDITDQLTQDKAAFTQEIQDALVYLENASSVASALRTPRKIQGVDFDGTQDINLPVFTTELDGLVPKRVGATSTKYLREDGTWVIPTNTSYTLLTQANAEAGTATTANTISAKVLKDAIQYHTPVVTNIAGNAGTASKLQTSRTISLTGGVTGSVSFDGSANATIAATVTGLGVANGIATLDASGQVPSTQLPSYVDDVLEYLNVAAFPTTGETGKIYVETTGNTTYRWSGTGYVKITSGEVASVAGKTGVVTLTKTDVGLPNVDNTADSVKSVATAAKLTTARTIGGISFDGSANINLPGVNITGNQSTSGNAGSATKLATARTLTVGNTGKTFDGSANVGWTVKEVLPSATSGQFLKFDGTNWIAAADNDTTYSAMSQAEANTGTDTTSRVITAAVLKEAIKTHSAGQSDIVGNASTATKLQTPRAINGVLFDGTQDISLPVPEAYTLPTASASVLGGIKVGSGLSVSNSVLSVGTLNQSTTGNAGSATKLATARTISLTGAVMGSVNFDGTNNVNIATTIAGALGIANGGTGGTSAAEARTNLDVYSKDEVNTAITSSVPIVADASTIDKGIVRLASESDITSLSEIVAVTPKNVDDMLAGAIPLTKSFCALLSARLQQMTGNSSADGQTITCNILAHGLDVGDVININYRYKDKPYSGHATDTVTVTSVVDVNTFIFTSPRVIYGSTTPSTCKLLYVISNSYNVDSLVMNEIGRYTITFNAAAGITDKTFVPFVQATPASTSSMIAQPEEITSATSLTVRISTTSGTLITPQWLYIGVIR